MNTIIESVAHTSIPVHVLSTEEQQVADLLYDSAKMASEGALMNPGLADSLKVTQLIGQVMKLMEKQAQLSGKSKKSIALYLGRKLIESVVKDEAVKVLLLTLYDSIAETTLETLVDVSRYVNTAVKEAAVSCCSWLSHGSH